MKKLLLLLLILTAALSISACSDEEKTGAGDKEYILGENAFGVKISVRNMTSDNVTFIVTPHADESGYGGQGEVDGPGGVYGTYGLVPGRKIGDKAALEGSFTLYANDKSGPSVTIDIEDTYVITDLKSNFSTMHYYLYEDGQFIKSDRETVNK